MKTDHSKYVALLRGINVGGKNLIPKEELRQSFENFGFQNVRTYIQSGNILFRSEQTRVKELTKTIEQGLSERFDYAARAVIFPYKRYQQAVDSAPDGWSDDDTQKHNALFLLGNLTPEEVIAALPSPKRDIETVTCGHNMVFWSTSKESLTRTTFMKLPAAPIYQEVTVRNHNTVLKLLKLFEEI